MMESVLGFIILKFILWIFPSRKIEDVSISLLINIGNKNDIMTSTLPKYHKMPGGGMPQWMDHDIK